MNYTPITGVSEAFKLHLLNNKHVRKINKEFDFYNVRFFKEEKHADLRVSLEHPISQYWYVDFKKFVISEILPYSEFDKEWEQVFKLVRESITAKYDEFKYNINNIEPATVLHCMHKYNLRDYQAYDMLELRKKLLMNSETIHSWGSGLILSEQRTGKTRVALATLCNEFYMACQSMTTLIVCPKIAIQGWIEEIEAMHEHYRSTFSVDPGTLWEYETIDSIKSLSKLNNAGTICKFRLITYELFKKLTPAQLNKIFINSKGKAALVCDEVHRLRNFKTQQSKAVFNLTKIVNKMDLHLIKIGLTGTPSVKADEDIFGTLCFVNTDKHFSLKPTHKDFAAFKEHFYACQDSEYGKQVIGIKRENELKLLIQRYSVQTKQRDLDLFKDYKKEYKKVLLDMDDLQRKAYDEVFEEFETACGEIDCPDVLTKFLRVRQVCTNPAGLLPSYGVVAPKFKWILNFIKANKDTGIIIMSKSTQVLDRLNSLIQLTNYTAYIKGSLSTQLRKLEIDSFKKGDVKIILIQQDVGKEALTLPQAQCTIFLDRDFAQGFNEQAEARMTPVDGKPCTKYVIDLVMYNSVEENIYDKLVIKKSSIGNANSLLKGGE